MRVWLATGHTDMRKGFGSLALLVQETFKRDPHAGDVWVFRGRRGDLIKVLWHDGDGACLFAKKIGAGPISMAIRARRSGDDLGGADVVSPVRNRLANAAENLASYGGGISATD